ncbi:PASTA domain-containing protein [Streptomyces sp. ME01-18a]|uniref:PASTA domain-containing protein n=1 Tax=Streptomyces sp. ME01-18a TaxID=3028669 RepID=UPI0029AC2D8C|nr:PASTA domain-containing protein [Streptomyces sp. ME01-18a]MDX3433924.1 PASTA domain-containing protein [Streptomyces sp. ME01-18a]
MLIGAILIGRTVFSSTDGSGGEVDVPDLIGSTMEQAQGRADNAEVKLAVGSKEPCANQEKGKICSQSPSPSEKMETGETVTAVVSTGAPKIEVPDVLEKSEDSARKALEDKGFTVNVKTAESEKTVDTVISQDPEGGSKVEKDTEVTITVAKEATVPMPDVRTRSYDAAVAQLNGLGFTNVSKQDVDSEEAAGTVIEQTGSERAVQGRPDRPEGLQGARLSPSSPSRSPSRPTSSVSGSSRRRQRSKEWASWSRSRPTRPTSRTPW